jgi:hypothetical protein
MRPTRGIRHGLQSVLALGLAVGLGCTRPTAPSAPRSTASAPERQFGRNQYVEYVPGDIPLILTAPHGGSLAPEEIPDRTSGETSTDSQSQPLALAICDALVRRTGHRPHLVLCHLRRTKLDANRELAVAAQGSPAASQAWSEFHGYIETARRAVESASGRGLLIDLHGHAHPAGRIELGYLIQPSDLNRDDRELNQPEWAALSSLQNSLLISGHSLSNLLRGPESLGASLEARGYSSLPGPQRPRPGQEAYFRGGYVTQRHGKGGLDAIQIETPFRTVRQTPATRAAFADAVADALITYLRQNLKLELKPR